MSSLRSIQDRCYRAFLFGESPPLLDELVDREIPAAISVQVYQNNARETFRQALAASYPVVEKLVGDDCFRGIARKYMLEHPSTSGDLQGFGAALPRLLAELYERSEFAYLPDVARLEWAMEEVQLVAEDEPLDLSRLAEIEPDRHADLVFFPARSARLVGSQYPILSIWRSNQPGVEIDISLSSGEEHVVVRRRGGDVELSPVEPSAARLAHHFENGATLGDALNAAAGNGGAPEALDLGTALRDLASAGLLSRFELSHPDTSRMKPQGPQR